MHPGQSFSSPSIIPQPRQPPVSRSGQQHEVFSIDLESGTDSEDVLFVPDSGQSQSEGVLFVETEDSADQGRFSPDFGLSWTDPDSDYMSSYDNDQFSSSWETHRATDSGPSHTVSRNTTGNRNVSPNPRRTIPPPPFSTPPKLQTVEQVMSKYSGTDVASLLILTTNPLAPTP
jgi:hypothetical protein